MTRGELLHRMSASELAYWAAYFDQEPWGEERADLRSAIVASTIANVNRGKGRKPFRPRDFMPFAPREKTALDTKISAAMQSLQKRGN
jgi:hypothetical protein